LAQPARITAVAMRLDLKDLKAKEGVEMRGYMVL
jgi:hypothetical protein